MHIIIYMVFLCCSAVRLVNAPRVRATPRSRSSRNRFGSVPASPALCPCKLRRPPGVKQAVSYGARSWEVRLVVLELQTLTYTDSLRNYNTRLHEYFQANTTFITSTVRIYEIPRKEKRQQVSPRGFRSYLDQRGPSRNRFPAHPHAPTKNRHRFCPVQASPALCPCEPHRKPAAARSKPCLDGQKRLPFEFVRKNRGSGTAPSPPRSPSLALAPVLSPIRPCAAM